MVGRDVLDRDGSLEFTDIGALLVVRPGGMPNGRPMRWRPGRRRESRSQRIGGVLARLAMVPGHVIVRFLIHTHRRELRTHYLSSCWQRQRRFEPCAGYRDLGWIDVEPGAEDSEP